MGLSSIEKVIEIEATAEIEDSKFEFAEYNEEEAEKTGYSNYSYWHSTWKSFLKNKTAVVLMILVVGLLTFTLIQPYLPNQYDPTVVNTSETTGRQLRNMPPRVAFLESIGAIDLDKTGFNPYKLNQVEDKYFWFGTNAIGQDLWSRIWSGTRTSLFIGLIVGLSELVIGILIGSLWGYVRKLDGLITEVYNVINNIPRTIILLLFAYIMKPGLFTIIFAMAITRWTQMARFVRNLIIIIRDREYNLASRCLGTPTSRIIKKNLLPYLVSVIMLRLALAIPLAIGSEVFLTYIGIGLPVDIPSLGNLINEGRVFIMVPALRYQLLFPAAVLSVITISFYVIGNAFADAADPKNHI
ncbi:ABC transporter permease [Acidaminobacter sp. JC074]|uniref:ABC transporter permease n=1 Tax=Acidaminobacter sp. JC074 TaxID=2530199 RepID=UPI001F0F5A88|nr:ABC transporter permease [Acidaminobacter sp. JC074]MCH4887452.1 ABC transporter permease [Acidaminobacter sp. JC074]